MFAKLKTWVLENKAVVVILLTILSSVASVHFRLQSSPPGTIPEVIVILPDSPQPVLGIAPQSAPVALAGEWVLAAKIALKVAIAILEKRAPLTPGDFDDRLLAFLKLIAGDHAAFERAHAAAMGPP